MDRTSLKHYLGQGFISVLTDVVFAIPQRIRQKLHLLSQIRTTYADEVSLQFELPKYYMNQRFTDLNKNVLSSVQFENIKSSLFLYSFINQCFQNHQNEVIHIEFFKIKINMQELQKAPLQSDSLFDSPSCIDNQLDQARVETQSVWSSATWSVNTESLPSNSRAKMHSKGSKAQISGFQQSLNICYQDKRSNANNYERNRSNIFACSQSSYLSSELNKARIEDSVCSSLSGSRTPESKLVKAFGKKNQLHIQKKRAQFCQQKWNFQRQIESFISSQNMKQQTRPYQLMTPKRPTQQKNCTQGIERHSKTKTLTAKIRRRNDLSVVDMCPICLGQFDNPKARLSCKHQFCYACLQSWSKSSTNCPCCRFQFDRITKLKKKQQNGKQSETKKVSAENSQEYEEEEVIVQKKQYQFDFDEYYTCYACFRGDNEHVLFICDQCDFYSCHVYCDQRLDGVIPEGDWYCKHCCQRDPDLQTEMLQDLQYSNLRYQANQTESDTQQDQDQEQDLSHANESVNAFFHRFDQSNPRLYIEDADLTSLDSQSVAPIARRVEVEQSQLPVARRTRRATINNLQLNQQSRVNRRGRGNQQGNVRRNGRIRQQEQARSTAMRLRQLRRRN